MSSLTKEQLLKYAQAWQAFILILPWYLNEFGLDTLNRLLGFVGLLIVFVILFLNRGETEKVAVAVGTIDRFLKSQVETIKTKEVSEKDTDTESLIEDLYKLYHMFKELPVKSDEEIPIVSEVEGGTDG